MGHSPTKGEGRRVVRRELSKGGGQTAKPGPQDGLNREARRRAWASPVPVFAEAREGEPEKGPLLLATRRRGAFRRPLPGGEALAQGPRGAGAGGAGGAGRGGAAGGSAGPGRLFLFLPLRPGPPGPAMPPPPKRAREPAELEQQRRREQKRRRRDAQQRQQLQHLESFYEKPPPGLIKEDETKPEDCIPDVPGNEHAREFLAHAPTKGLWMPLGKEVKVMQCWRCKRYGHRTGDKECPFFIKGNQKLEQFRVAHEDPMYDIIRENKRHEKDVRVPIKPWSYQKCFKVTCSIKSPFFLLKDYTSSVVLAYTLCRISRRSFEDTTAKEATGGFYLR
ncbi:retinitis pigmentosa 9 protein [Notamacropus eugenii]|uniref:retinitis pigmentosa 9 protein n=1 Tax=Notamacropus eugenii TaxID=9315 RepID=UPI003B673755